MNIIISTTIILLFIPELENSYIITLISIELKKKILHQNKKKSGHTLHSRYFSVLGQNDSVEYREP